MENKFDIEIWPNVQKMKTVYTSIVIITILAWICFAVGSFFWDEYTYPIVSLRGRHGTGGWPVTLYRGGLYTGIAGIAGFIIVRAMQDNKNPSLALNKNGLYINQQLIKQTMVEWSNISRIEKKYKDGEIELDIYFADADKIVEMQTGARKTFVKENLKERKPLTVNNKLALGDFDGLVKRAEAYMNK